MYIVFDIGGTHTRIATSEDGKTLGDPVIRNTPQDWNEAAGLFEEVFGTLSQGKEIDGVAGGLPGVIDGEKGTIVRSPNLLDWVGKPIAEVMTKAAGAPVRLYNDTVAIGVGEATLGAGKGFEIVVYMTVSTGVGGARIVGGHVDEFRFGFEPGQQIIDVNELLSLEDAVSGAAFKKKYGADFVQQAPGAAWEEAARRLAVGIHNTVVHWSPDVVIVGGPMVLKTPGIPLAVVLEHLKRILAIFPKAPEVRTPVLGEKGGLLGALALATSKK